MSGTHFGTDPGARPMAEGRAPGSGSISRKLQFSHLSEKLPPISLLPQALRDNTEENLSLIFSSKEVLCQPMLIYDACDQAWCLRTSQSVILTVISLGAPASQGQPSNQVLEMDTLWKRKQWVKDEYLHDVTAQDEAATQALILSSKSALFFQSHFHINQARPGDASLSGFAFEMMLVLMAVRALRGHSLKYHWTET